MLRLCLLMVDWWIFHQKLDPPSVGELAAAAVAAGADHDGSDDTSSGSSFAGDPRRVAAGLADVELKIRVRLLPSCLNLNLNPVPSNRLSDLASVQGAEYVPIALAASFHSTRLRDLCPE